MRRPTAAATALALAVAAALLLPSPSAQAGPPGGPPAVLVNGGFEDGAAGWSFSAGTGVAAERPHTGARMAHLDAGAGGSVSTDLTVWRSGVFQVSAWVATGGTDGRIVVRRNGAEAASQRLPTEPVYQRYVAGGVAVRPGDELEVAVVSATDGRIDVDDVEFGVDVGEIAVRSANPKVADLFAWAKAKANNWVIREGTVGLVNSDERNPAGTGTATYRASYWAGYRFRTAYYSRDLAHQLVGGHLIGLHRENKNMLRSFAASATEPRKFYPVWAVNFDTVTPLSIDYRSDTRFVREVPAPFEIVEKSDTAYRWTGDPDYVVDDAMWTYYLNTLSRFVEAHNSRIPNGPVQVAEGVSRSIFEGVASYNEGGEGLIEAGDAIGSQYRAYLAMVNLATARGDAATAGTYRTRAADLRRYYNEVWSVAPGTDQLVRGYKVDATTGEALPMTGWGKENSWFMPMKEIVDPGPRLSDYLDFIDARSEDPATRPRNIEATSYLPDTFFPYHRDATAWKWMQYIYDKRNDPHVNPRQGTNGNYPESSFVLVSQTVQGLLGVQPDAGRDTVTTRSHLPADIGWLQAANVRVGGSRITVRHDGVASSTLAHAAGDRTLHWQAQFQGEHPTVTVDGVARPATVTAVNGVPVSTVTVPVRPGQRATASVG
jgi:hypothetical protein